MTPPRAKPVRIQRKRAKGWRMPANAVYVGRPGRYGNPFHVGQEAPSHAQCVRLFQRWLGGSLSDDEIRIRFAAPNAQWYIAMRAGRRAAIASLRGRDLACWCRLDQPCHADVLLEFANR